MFTSTETRIAGQIAALQSVIGKEYKVTTTREDTFVLWSGGSHVIECEDLHDIANVLSEILDVVS